ncbi:MAG: hypothetical protein ABW185_04605 [Sedimenticola sp.]
MSTILAGPPRQRMDIHAPSSARARKMIQHKPPIALTCHIATD